MKNELIAIFIFAYFFSTVFKYVVTKKVIGWFPGGIIISFVLDVLQGEPKTAFADLLLEIIQVAIPAVMFTYATAVLMKII